MAMMKTSASSPIETPLHCHPH